MRLGDFAPAAGAKSSSLSLAPYISALLAASSLTSRAVNVLASPKSIIVLSME
jgi:hypothetical protein